MKLFTKLFLNTRALMTLIVISLFTIFIGCQNSSKCAYKYNICSDDGCDYTNKYSSIDNNCITFKSSFNGITTVCGNYRIYLMNCDNTENFKDN